MRHVSVRHKLQTTVIFFISLLAVFMYYYFPSQQKQALEESFRHQVQSLAQSVALGYTLAQRYEDYSGLKAAIDHARSDKSLRFVAVVSGGLTLFSYP
jgi:sensor histidine kinase regulating citrate/malate metabolism